MEMNATALHRGTIAICSVHTSFLPGLIKECSCILHPMNKKQLGLHLLDSTLNTLNKRLADRKLSVHNI